MTGPCAGAATGVPKPGFAALQYIAPGAIGGALASLSGWAGAAVGAAIGAITYELTTFCPSGPPPMPVFSGAEIALLLSGFPSPARDVAAAKFADFIGNVFWPLLCDCTGGAANTLGPPSTFPADAPSTFNVVAPCITNVGGATNPGGGSFSFRGVLVWQMGDVRFVRVQLNTRLVTGTGQLVHVTCKFEDGSGADIPTQQFQYDVGPVTARVEHDILVPFGAVAHYCNATWLAGGGQTELQITEFGFCGPSSPTLGPAPCCPPDPQLLELVADLQAKVTLIQKYGVPFGYVDGASHGGLTGRGTIAFDGALGARIEITTLPSGKGSLFGEPDYVLDLGWISVMDDNGFIDEHRVSRLSFVWLSKLFPAGQIVGYALETGVVATITLLNPEP